MARPLIEFVDAYQLLLAKGGHGEVWSFPDISLVMLTPKRMTWFFIADGAKARLFESFGYREPWSLRDEWRDDTARLPARALGNERPGRGHTIGSHSRYAMAKGSKHESAEGGFVKLRIDFINLSRDEFDQLVLAAPPGVLGAMRKGLLPEVCSKFTAVFDKDLTNMPDQQLLDYFKKHLERW